MTPVETFSPHFSNAVAKYIARETKAAASTEGRPRSTPEKQNKRGFSRAATGGGGGKPLVLYEAGGGTGTNALNVLNWLKREEPRLYERTEYTIIEISERLAERQMERVCAVHQVRLKALLLAGGIGTRICWRRGTRDAVAAQCALILSVVERLFYCWC